MTKPHRLCSIENLNIIFTLKNLSNYKPNETLCDVFSRTRCKDTVFSQQTQIYSLIFLLKIQLC